MSEAKDRFFYKTQHLISRLNIFRMLVLAVISIGFVILFFSLFKYPINLTFVLLVIAISFIYAFVRDVIVTRHNVKVMNIHHDYTFERRPNIDLYIPIFYRTNQILTPKKASLFVAKDVLYLEAYKRVHFRNKLEKSNVARCNRDFHIYDYTVDRSDKFVNYKAQLAGTTYNFSVINDKELIQIIEKCKEN